MAKLKSQRTTVADHAVESSRLARHGLSLPKVLLRALEDSGIYCFPGISVEHQHLSHRFVLKGTESGGAVESMGRYCGFLGEDGQALPWLQPLDSFGGNGRHAIVIATTMLRIEMVRVERTYDLLITRHELSQAADAQRPQMQSSVVFRGRSGTLFGELEPGDVVPAAMGLAPIFYTAAGEVHPHPARFEDAIRAITSAVGCARCKHTHIAVRPTIRATDRP